MQHNPIQIPPPDVLRSLPEEAIASAIDQLIGVLDEREGDPDLEDAEGQLFVDAKGHYIGPDPSLFDDEDREQAWPEWHTLGRHKDWSRFSAAALLEDAEDDDPREDDDPEACTAGDDNLTDWGPWVGYYPDRGAGDPEDAEDDDPGGGAVDDEPHDPDSDGF